MIPRIPSILTTGHYLLCLLWPLVGAEIGLRVSPSAQVVNQASNQQFVVTCQGMGADPALFSDFKWFDPRSRQINKDYSERINADLRVEEASVGTLLLHFLNPNPDNSGQYTCSAEFQHSDTFRTAIQINFFQDVAWDDCPKVQSLVLGSTHERIRCKAQSNPKPSISWTKDDKELDPNRYQIDSNGLSINDVVRESDGGEFRVRALVMETGRLHETLISVQIHIKPEIQELANQMNGIEGEESTLHCSANGRPQPLITWLDPNKRNLSLVGGYHVDRNSGTLIISRVKLIENSGQYTCIAENESGRDQKTTQFVVIRRPVITSFNNQSFDQNSNSVLECRATGEPFPVLSVRRDGDSRDLQTGDPRVVLQEFRQKEESVLRLEIKQTRREDDGLYFCRATNAAANVERAGHLEVRFAPDLSRTPLRSVRHWELQPINITCIADAIPNATIIWWYNGVDLRQRQDVYTIEDNSAGISRLHINVRQSRLRDIYGQYRCEAINSLGRSEIRIQLDQAFKPGSVIETRTDRITATTILFRVFAPSFDGGLPINYMHIQYRKETDSQLMTKKWAIDKYDTYLLDGLRPRTRYWIKFAAQNAVGIGDWSAEKMVETYRETRPEKPQFRNLPLDANHQIVSPFSDQFMATWTLPEDNGRQIGYFEVKYYPVRKVSDGFEPIRSEERVESVSMSDQSMTSYTLRGLRPNSYYRIEVRAHNELGFSDFESIVFKTSDGPEPEREDVEKDGLRVGSIGVWVALVISGILVLVVVSDVFFFCRYRVGVIYFLSENVFKAKEEVPKCVENRAFESQQTTTADDQNEPFFGRASAV